MILKIKNRTYMENVYKKSFIFKASQYEEYQDGVCLRNGFVNCTIVAKILSSDTIEFALLDEVPPKINPRFWLPISGIEYDGDILQDRVQYGRLPKSFSWEDSNEPIVCNIFNNMHCIRFAMLSPLRIIEFLGNFEEIRG